MELFKNAGTDRAIVGRLLSGKSVVLNVRSGGSEQSITTNAHLRHTADSEVFSHGKTCACEESDKVCRLYPKPCS